MSHITAQSVLGPPPKVWDPNNWKKFDVPKPYVTVSGLALDCKGRFILMHRSAKVRSARDCWSLPSGLHECGKTMQEQFGEELKEELNLTPIITKNAMIGHYENIRPDGLMHAGWHWVIFVMLMRVESLDPLVNKEPDKHDQIEIVNIRQDWITGRTWAPKLREFLVPNLKLITQSAFNIL
jgi:ADP-ribose pyrophosphatase YjhB (NUDIX family)